MKRSFLIMLAKTWSPAVFGAITAGQSSGCQPATNETPASREIIQIGPPELLTPIALGRQMSKATWLPDREDSGRHRQRDRPGAARRHQPAPSGGKAV